jgi:hypothetical protein
VLEFDVDGVEVVDEGRVVLVGAVVIGAHPDLRIRREPVRPASEEVPAPHGARQRAGGRRPADDDERGTDLADFPRVRVSLERHRVLRIGLPVGAKAEMAQLPAVAGRGGRTVLAGPIEALGEDPEPEPLRGLLAVADGAEAALRGAAASFEVGALGVLRALADDVDDAVDRVRAPERCPRSADDLDAVYVLEEQVLHVPEDAREERGIDAAGVREDEQLGRVDAAEPARAHSPPARGDLGHVQARDQSEGLRNRPRPVPPHGLVGDDGDGRGGGGERLFRLGDGSDLDLRQLFQRELGEVASFAGGRGARGDRQAGRQQMDDVPGAEPQDATKPATDGVGFFEYSVRANTYA